MTIQQAAQLALDVQNACNLSGVVRSFAQVTEALWEEARRIKQGTEFVNQHPISQLFASKIEDLTRVNYGVGAFSKAYDACEQLASSKEQA